MAITNPNLQAGFDTNQTNSLAPASPLIANGYAFKSIPASSEHNYMFGNILNYLNYLKATGISRWDAGITYKKQSMIARDEIVYFSLTDGNLANDPLTSNFSQWIDWVSLSNASYKTTAISNVGGISTLTCAPYLGSTVAPTSGFILQVRVVTGTITSPASLKITIGANTYDCLGKVDFADAASTGRIVNAYFNGTSFTIINGVATETNKGNVELATTSEVLTGTDTGRAVTPAGVQAKTASSAETITGTAWNKFVTPASLQAKVASTSAKGILELATSAETITGTDTTRAVTPAGLQAKVASTTAKGIVQLNNTLTSTSTTEALTAAQGKVLNDKIGNKLDIYIEQAGSNAYGSYIKYSNGTIDMIVEVNSSGAIGQASSVTLTKTLPASLSSTASSNVTFQQYVGGNPFVIPSIAYANTTSQITLVLGNTTGSTRDYSVATARVTGRWK